MTGASAGRSFRWRRREIRVPPIAESPASPPIGPNCANTWGRFPALDTVEEWFSSVTGGTVLEGFDLPIVHEPRSVSQLPLLTLRLPIQVRDLVRRTQMQGGIAMAIPAEGHAKRLGVVNIVHLVDLPAALHAPD